MTYDFYKDIRNILRKNSKNDKVSIESVNNLLCRKFRLNKVRTKQILKEMKERELICLEKRQIIIR